ncbi:hypothetical protein GOBAR_DD25559 [Gossypium barbadense]|nr:hypothetical protein GOBAR_DD25559 [Gossypium barbadense]
MPSLRMKAKSSTGSLREKNGLRVCQKSSVICKRPCCHVRVSQQGAEFSSCIQNSHDDSSNVDVAPQGFETDGADVQQLILDEENSELQKQLSVFVDSATMGRMARNCPQLCLKLRDNILSFSGVNPNKQST